jgi:hypothetical protein
MKIGREHRLPLSEAATALLQTLARRGPYLFPGADRHSRRIRCCTCSRSSWAAPTRPLFTDFAHASRTGLLSRRISRARFGKWRSPTRSATRSRRPTGAAISSTQANANTAALINKGALGGNTPDDILRDQYRRHFAATPTGMFASNAISMQSLVLNVSRPQPCNFPRVIPEIDIWRAANLMLKRYGEKARGERHARRRTRGRR